MKKKISLICCLLFLHFGALAQNEGNIWMFGNSNSIQFSNGVPVYGGIPGTGTDVSIPFYRSNAISDASGNLLFFVKIDNANLSGNPPAASTRHNIYNRLGQAMNNSVLVYAAPIAGPIQIIKKPGLNQMYYVIYSLNNALLSTTVDMSLNGGLGGIVASEKGVLISGWQTVVGEKTTVIQGCDCIWLIVRSRTANQYKSYRITEAGIDHNPVLSSCGLLPMGKYFDVYIGPPGGATMDILGQGIGKAGLLKASPDGKKIVACCEKGLELYDFSKCSGKISNAKLIDTTAYYQACYYGAAVGNYCHDSIPICYYSAEFSPDNSKLYATYFYGRKVFQFDLSLASNAAIIGSKIAVLTNRPMIESDIVNGCTIIDTTGIGDLKRGPDGKIYIGNNTILGCAITPQSAQNMALHVINDPNLPGLACSAQQEAFILGPLNENKYQTSVNFNPQIVMPPAARDTLTSTRRISLCIGSVLQADTPGDCYLWNTGVESPKIIVDTSGQYIVHWGSDDCILHIDTFEVYVPPFPEVPLLQYGCPGETGIVVRNSEYDTCNYTYNLYDEGGILLRTETSNAGYNFSDLDGGMYFLQISTAGGCDTTISITLDEYPEPNVAAAPSDTTIHYGDSIRLDATGASLYVWSPTGSLDSATMPNPITRPLQPTILTVVGINDYGCRDTALVHIDLDYLIPDMIPNAFSPNGDGLNDLFGIEGITYQKIIQFRIFNRYGQVVFFSNGGHKGWDGIYKGQPCDTGTYYYYIQLVYPDGKVKEFKGDVTLMR